MANESSKKLLHALCNQSLIGVIRDFGIFQKSLKFCLTTFHFHYISSAEERFEKDFIHQNLFKKEGGKR